MKSKRVQNLKPSTTMALSEKATDLKKRGEDVISLSIGEPSWDTFDNIKQEGIKAIKSGFTKYTPGSGILDLKKAITHKIEQEMQLKYSPSQVVISSGAKSILFSTLQCLLDPGDEVLVLKPYWVSYLSQIELCGGVPVVVPGEFKNKFIPDAKTLESKITSKTKAIIFNSPNNPTGLLYEKEDWESFITVLKKYPDIFIITDDIYNYLVFNESCRAPHILESNSDLVNRTVIVNGVSKAYSMTGWRIGWAVGPKDFISSMSAFQSQAYGCPNSIAQKASVAALTYSEKDMFNKVQQLKQKRDFVFKKLQSCSLLKFHLPQGAFYFFIDCSLVFGKKSKGKIIQNSSDFSNLLLSDQGVVVVPGGEFGCDNFFRINYALSEAVMSDAIDRILNFINNLTD